MESVRIGINARKVRPTRFVSTSEFRRNHFAPEFEYRQRDSKRKEPIKRLSSTTRKLSQITQARWCCNGSYFLINSVEGQLRSESSDTFCRQHFPRMRWLADAIAPRGTWVNKKPMTALERDPGHIRKASTSWFVEQQGNRNV